MSAPVPTAAELERLAERPCFATAASTAQRKGEPEIVWADRTFRPAFPGVHACGADHDENRFFTIFNVPARDDAEARSRWLAAKEVAEVSREEGDLLIDLNTTDGHEDDFWTNRQLLPLAYEAARASLARDLAGEGR